MALCKDPKSTEPKSAEERILELEKIGNHLLTLLELEKMVNHLKTELMVIKNTGLSNEKTLDRYVKNILERLDKLENESSTFSDPRRFDRFGPISPFTGMMNNLHSFMTNLENGNRLPRKPKQDSHRPSFRPNPFAVRSTIESQMGECLCRIAPAFISDVQPFKRNVVVITTRQITDDIIKQLPKNVDGYTIVFTYNQLLLITLNKEIINVTSDILPNLTKSRNDFLSFLHPELDSSFLNQIAHNFANICNDYSSRSLKSVQAKEGSLLNENTFYILFERNE